MNALNYFLNDLVVVVVFPLTIIILALVWSAKSSFKRHDLILEHIKKKGWVLIQKEWYTDKVETENHIANTYYVIKYLDKNKRLHKARVTADEWNNEVEIFSDELID